MKNILLMMLIFMNKKEAYTKKKEPLGSFFKDKINCLLFSKCNHVLKQISIFAYFFFITIHTDGIL